MKHDTEKSRETARMLEREAGYRRSPGYKREVIDGICTSMASFIAAIDKDSRDVRDYIRQRLGAVLEHAPLDELEEVGKDGRQLGGATAGEAKPATCKTCGGDGFCKGPCGDCHGKCHACFGSGRGARP